MTKVYIDGTTLQDILSDGWSRGFQASQTIDEANSMGFTVTELEVLETWEKFDKKLDSWVDFEKEQAIEEELEEEKEAGWVDWDR